MICKSAKTNNFFDYFFLKILFCVFSIALNSCKPKSNIDQDVLKGETFLSQNNLDSAQFYFYKILELDSNNNTAINRLADIHFRKVEIGKSLRFFNKSVSIDSTNEDAYFKIAEINLFLGDYKSVFKNINKGLKINERKSEAYFMKGVAYKHIGDTIKAVSSFKTAIELNHELAEVYYELGLLLTLQNDPLAIDYYKLGIESNPKDSDLKMSLAWSLQQFNKHKEADDAYFKVVKEFPMHTRAKSNYAIFKYQLSQVDTALLMCNEVLMLDSLNYPMLNLKGIILKEKGKFKESKKLMEKLYLIEAQSEFF